jgi:hypothetical protein
MMVQRMRVAAHSWRTQAECWLALIRQPVAGRAPVAGLKDDLRSVIPHPALLRYHRAASEHDGRNRG